MLMRSSKPRWSFCSACGCRVAPRTLLLSARLSLFQDSLHAAARLHTRDIYRETRQTAKANSFVVDESNWEVTCGLEVHAQLASPNKLFSTSSSPSGHPSSEPNTLISPFDLAVPGTQPRLNKHAVFLAATAAVALQSQVMPRSGWDRKHYFYKDQPNGYQITQFYKPLARGGRLILKARDLPGLADAASRQPADELFRVDLKQIQMEQDTAKSTVQSDSETLVDYNRASASLIEIVTEPFSIASESKSASADAGLITGTVFRKIARYLSAIGAVTAGMELGGLRADVNVSVRKRQQHGAAGDALLPLGQRVEIKNLYAPSSVASAVRHEAKRQISALSTEPAQRIVAETRGWDAATNSTYTLRLKEGEVDYRYMPEPDLQEVIVDSLFLNDIKKLLPELPDESVDRLVTACGLSHVDALAIVDQDSGARVQYFEQVLALVMGDLHATVEQQHRLGRMAGNWLLHMLGGVLNDEGVSWSENPVDAPRLAQLIVQVESGTLSASSGKTLLRLLFSSESGVEKLIAEHGLALKPLSADEMDRIILKVASEYPEKAELVKARGKRWQGAARMLTGMVVKEVKARGGDAGEVSELVEKTLRK